MAAAFSYRFWGVNDENARVDCGDERAKGVKDKTGPTTRGCDLRFVVSHAFPSAFSATFAPLFILSSSTINAFGVIFSCIY